MRPLLSSFSFAAWFFIALMSFACVLPCPSSFSTRGGLSRHQNNCLSFQTLLALRVEQRRVTSVKIRKARATLRSQSQTLQPSTNSQSSQPPPSTESQPSPSTLNLEPTPQTDSESQLPESGSGMSAPLVVENLLESAPGIVGDPHQSSTTSGSVRLPRQFQDDVPDQPTPIPLETRPPAIRRVILHVRERFRSVVNQFYVLREYHDRRPSYDPDVQVKPEDLANFRTTEALPDAEYPLPPNAQHPPPPWPFENMTKYLLMNWFHTGGNQKSEGEVDRLVKEVLTSSDFRPADLADFSVHRANKSLDEARLETPNQKDMPFSSDGWQEISVDIEIPVPSKGAPPQIFQIPGFHRRSLIEVIKVAWGSAQALNFHLYPFKRIHVDPSSKEETRIYDEVYTSDAWLDAHDRLQKQPNQEGCKLEKVIAGLMFWSDSTHLTNFGTASVWPIYMYFANLSKYIRAKPNSGACHHVAYIPHVSLCLIPNQILIFE